MGRRMMLAIAGICVAIGGCQSAAIASPEPSVRWTPVADGPGGRCIVAVATTHHDAAPTSEPRRPARTDHPARSRTHATKTRDDIRVTVTMQRNPLPAGERSWVKTRVENLGATDDDVVRTIGCARPVWGRRAGRRAMALWTRRMRATRRQFKDLVLGVLGQQEEPLRTNRLVPAETAPWSRHLWVRRTWAWPRPSSQARRSARRVGGRDSTSGAWGSRHQVVCSCAWRQRSTGEGPSRWTTSRTTAIRLKLDAWISQGVSSARPTPPEIVDAALADADFATFPWRRRSSPTAARYLPWYDAEEDRWEVGVMPWYETEPPRIHGVLVDAATGEVIAPLDRPWIHDVDPAAVLTTIG